MPPAPAIDAHVHLDEHPTHSRAVIATLTGAQAHVAHVALEAADWTVVGDNILALVRIDPEEPYWAKDTATHLAAAGIAVDITPRLQEAMDEEWTWVSYPMPWCTRSEVREVSNEAQKIHDDIRHGHLLIHAHAHAHAHDGHTTVAVGTYLHGAGKSVYLHGENHLRQVADTFDSPAQALLAFEKVHGAQMRPGPAPLTDTERSAAEARKPLAPPTTEPEPPAPEPVPVYLADAGDHDALLDTHGEFEKWRTWSDETTHAIHETQTLRIERVHETQPRDIAWTIAAYETPVSERLWVLAAITGTPAPVLEELLTRLADGAGWDTAVNPPLDECAVAAAACRCRVATPLERAWDPLDSPRPEGRRSVRHLDRPEPAEPSDVDDLGRSRPGAADLDHHRVPAHPGFTARGPLQDPHPHHRPSSPPCRERRTRDESRHQLPGHTCGHS